MLNAGRVRDVLRVVADQKGCPTTAIDLADAILAIADRILNDGWRDEFGGVFHAAGAGWTTWHGLACATFAAAAAQAPGLKIPTVEPIATADWPTPARRPADSRLDCSKLVQVFGLRLPPWEDGLLRTLAAMDLAA
jgi:dTDP-4-dehydrorhamnose reductase